MGQVLLGALGGLAGTAAMGGVLKVAQKRLPGTIPPIRKDPGQFMVKQAEHLLPRRMRRRIPKAAESTAAQLLAAGYGLTFGALYAALRPRAGGHPIREGLALGTLTWAAGYLGWLPATGLMPPVWKQSAPRALAPLAEHALYGVVAVAVYDWLRDSVRGGRCCD
jgi:hypothetical protein